MGFDYVPVEPIVSANQDKKNKLRTVVNTRVLPGPSFNTWLDEDGGIHNKSIFHVRNKIINGLTKLGINHGHLHQGNFVLVFEKNEEGNPDITKPPRVYVIDFDMAASSSSNS